MSGDGAEQPTPELVAEQRAWEVRQAAVFPRGAAPSGTVPVSDRSFHFGNQAHPEYVKMVTTDDAFMLESHWAARSRQTAPTEALHAQAVAQAGWWGSIADASWAETVTTFVGAVECWADVGAPQLDDVNGDCDDGSVDGS